MSDKAEQKTCGCGGQGSTIGESQPASDHLAQVVKAVVPQDHDAKFNIRLVPGHSLEKGLELQPLCRPRGHAPGWNHGGLAIDPGLVATLSKANNAMVGWLAKDAGNAQRFLANPVAAMREAGVELSRAEEKALVRSNEAAAASRVVGPGVRITALSAKAYPNGRVGGIGPGRTDGGGGKTDDFDCGPKRKG